MEHFTSDAIIFECIPLVYFHNIVALLQLNSRERSDGILMLISLDIKTLFHVQKQRNNSSIQYYSFFIKYPHHGCFENTFDHFGGNFHKSIEQYLQVITI